MLQPTPIEGILRLSSGSGAAPALAASATAAMLSALPASPAVITAPNATPNPTLDEAFLSFAETAANLELAYTSLRSDVVRLRSELSNERETRLRNEAMAEVAAVLAHEVRNPLGSLEIFTSLLEQAPELSLRSQRHVRQLQAGLRSLGSIVNTVLAFYNPAEPQVAPLDLHDLLDWAATFLAPLAERAQLQYQVSASPHALVMLADRTQLEQLLLNLVLNCCQHCAPGDTLRISASRAAELDRKLELAVSDSGGGIAQDDLARVFEPNFTTKPQGTGLGLAVVRRIVEQHGGRIQITSLPQQGTRVSMIFLAAEPNFQPNLQPNFQPSLQPSLQPNEVRA